MYILQVLCKSRDPCDVSNLNFEAVSFTSPLHLPSVAHSIPGRPKVRNLIRLSGLSAEH